jgi:hypothetical protein
MLLQKQLGEYDGAATPHGGGAFVDGFGADPFGQGLDKGSPTVTFTYHDNKGTDPAPIAVADAPFEDRSGQSDGAGQESRGKKSILVTGYYHR